MLKDMDQVKKDYQDFFRKHPNQKNPSDINTEEKFNFAIKIGWKRLRAMQNARKARYNFTLGYLNEDSNS